ncbi:hypothetical protein [Scytonema sp. PCC 10023]|uniref:hypothetical protein n=1 Tax=Scytonema sp. PCC 10023 TaxID=1680591 RepID=UPI0039C5BD09
MNYCKAGEKAIIKYKFPEKQETIYSSKNSPIKIVVQPITAKNYVFTGYYCEYWIDQCHQQTGRVLQSIRYGDSGSQSQGTLISPNTKIIYPPFEYPITEWLELSGFSLYCDYQYYRQGIKFSNSTGERRIAYFNFLGTAERTSRQASECYPPYVPRDITFRRVDGKEEPLKWEINIVDNQGNNFTDYGLGQPIYTCQCGDCPQNSMKCDFYKYPGYQCIPCSEFKSKIAAMRSMIRRIND